MPRISPDAAPESGMPKGTEVVCAFIPKAEFSSLSSPRRNCATTFWLGDTLTRGRWSSPMFTRSRSGTTQEVSPHVPVEANDLEELMACRRHETSTLRYASRDFRSYSLALRRMILFAWATALCPSMSAW